MNQILNVRTKCKQFYGVAFRVAAFLFCIIGLIIMMFTEPSHIGVFFVCSIVVLIYLLINFHFFNTHFYSLELREDGIIYQNALGKKYDIKYDDIFFERTKKKKYRYMVFKKYPYVEYTLQTKNRKISFSSLYVNVDDMQIIEDILNKNIASDI